MSMWSQEEDERLRRSVRENGVDDWNTLGDWGEVRGSLVPNFLPLQHKNILYIRKHVLVYRLVFRILCRSAR